MIDRKPAVGRLVLRESHLLNGLVGRGGVITSLAKTRINYDHAHSFGPPTPKYITKFSFCCDTQEEYDALIALDEACIRARYDLYKQQRKDLDLFIVANNAVPDSLGEPINPDFQYIMDRTTGTTDEAAW